MSPEELVLCIEEAFGGLDCPPSERLAAADTYVEESFIDAVGARAWQELRPLRQYIGDGSEIVLLSAKAYQYYLPAYLVALIDKAAEAFYLDGVLDSLWYDSGPSFRDGLIRDCFDPRKGLDETTRELANQAPGLTDEERRAAAAMRISVVEKLALVKDMTGHDWWNESSLSAGLQARWEERMPLLTGLQRKCVALFLAHILARTRDWLVAARVQTALDAYWGAFLGKPGNPGTDGK